MQIKEWKRIMTTAAVTVATSAVLPSLAADASSAVAIVPAPREMSVTGGECAAKGEPKFETVASIPPEGYELSVTKDGVTIRSSDAALRQVPRRAWTASHRLG